MERHEFWQKVAEIAYDSIDSSYGNFTFSTDYFVKKCMESPELTRIPSPDEVKDGVECYSEHFLPGFNHIVFNNKQATDLSDVHQMD